MGTTAGEDEVTEGHDWVMWFCFLALAVAGGALVLGAMFGQSSPAGMWAFAVLCSMVVVVVRLYMRRMLGR